MFIAPRKPVDVSRKNLLFRKTFLDSTCFFCLKPTRRVSPYLSDLEVNWTSSFPAQSDKLVIIPHLLLAPVGTVVRPAEHEFAHRPSPSPEAVSRCSQQNRRTIGGSFGVDTQILVFSKILVFNNLVVFSEMQVILVFSKLFGLITCDGWALSQSATQIIS